MKTFLKDSSLFFALLLLALLILLIHETANAQDIFVPSCSTNYSCQLAQNQPWASGNQTWIFAPIAPNVSIYIYLHNRNTTSPHTSQTINVFQTGSTTVSSLSSGADQWAQDSLTQNSIAGASCNNVNANAPTVPGASGTGTCYLLTMAAAQVAVKITGAAGANGSPDTFDLSIVQITGTPGGPQPGNAIYPVDSNTFQWNGIQTSVSAIGVPALAQAVSAGDNFNVGFNGLVSTIGLGTMTGSPQVLAENPVFINNQGTSNVDHSKSMSSINALQTLTQGSYLPGMQIVTTPATWTNTVQAASASNCSNTIAGVLATRHCVTGVDACLVATAAQTQLFVNLRDSTTGAGTIIWTSMLADTAGVGSCVSHEFSGGPICTSLLNRAITIELSAATAATNGCSTAVRGFDVQ